jgi:hypothetical protein
VTVVVWTLDSVRLRSIAKHLTASLHACYIPICGNSIFQSVPRKSAVFDSTIGRWQTKDPKSFDAGDTNLYRFVGNHPSYATDPSGLIKRSPVTVMFRSRREFEVANEEFTQYWIGPWYGRQMKNPTYDIALQYNYGITNESVIYALLGIDVETAESTLRTTTVYGERFGYLEVKGTTNDGEERTWYGMFEGGYGGKEHIGYTFYPSEETLRYNLSAINKLEALQSIANSWGIAASAAQLASIPLNGKLIPSKFSQQIAPRSTVRVFRVEGTPNTRILLGEGGAVGIVEDGTTLWLNFGSKARAEQYLSQKIAKGLPDATVKSFDVPKSLLDDIRASAVPESMAKQFPNRPIISRDPAPDQFGLRPDQIKELLDRIIQGTGREGF